MNPEFDAVLFESMEAASFDSISWVNRLIEAGGDMDDEALLNGVRSASARLQTRSQELSRDAERLMERLLAVGPRALQELDRVERDALTLKQDLKRVQEESRTSTGSTAPFQTLKSLDTIKTNLEKCVKVLQETGNWNSLVREMESYFAARNLGEVASRLSTMRSSLETLGNFPEATKRSDIMERMEQRLESLVRPGLQNALEQVSRGDFEPLKQSVVVFSKLGRRDGLLLDLGQSRGRICFEACWTAQSPTGGGNENDKHVYSRFLDRVLVHLREVELPICKYAFEVEDSIADAIAWIIRFCFQQISKDSVAKLLKPREKKSMDVGACEKYVLAHVASDRFIVDISSSFLVHCSALDTKDAALNAIAKPFVELDKQYLEWESAALVASLADHFASDSKVGDDNDGLDDLLGPSGWEQRMSRAKAEDILESLAEDCATRCEKIKLKGTIPVCQLFEAHATSCLGVVRENRKADDATRESGLLKTVAALKGRFYVALKRCQKEDDSSPRSSPRDRGGQQIISTVREGSNEAMYVTKTTEALERLTAESRLKLFNTFVFPALTLLDKAVNIGDVAAGAGGGGGSGQAMVGPSEAITKAVDHLLLLIPLLEFEMPLTDLIADPKVLGKSERDDLHALLGGSVLYEDAEHPSVGSLTAATMEDADELSRLISASWLEAIGRAMCTGFVLRVVRLKKVSDRFAAQLGADADCLEKNAGSVLAQNVLWDPALGVCRVVLSAAAGLTHLKLGNPVQYLDERYCQDSASTEPLKSLEHMLVALRNRS